MSDQEVALLGIPVYQQRRVFQATLLFRLRSVASDTSAMSLFVRDATPVDIVGWGRLFCTAGWDRLLRAAGFSRLSRTPGSCGHRVVLAGVGSGLRTAPN
jgi:hypothetical protein